MRARVRRPACGVGVRSTCSSHVAHALMDGARAEPDQQQHHAELESLRGNGWHFSPQHHQNGASQKQRQSVS